MPQLLYRSARPIRIAVLGAPEVGKTSIALQYITEQVVDTSPTSIEDVFRKEIKLKITDDQLMKLIQNRVQNDTMDKEELLEAVHDRVADMKNVFFASVGLHLSVEITDTAGYVSATPNKSTPRRSFLSKFSLKTRNGDISMPSTSESRSQGSRNSKNRNSTSLGSLSLMARLEACMKKCDGLVLVYNVLNPNTFSTARQIRNHFVNIHKNSKPKKSSTSDTFLQKTFLRKYCCPPFCKKRTEANQLVPPIYLVGTHSDLRAGYMAKEKSSRLYDVSFLRGNTDTVGRNHKIIKRKVAKGATLGRALVHPHDVYPVISEWKECTGFAEITSRDHHLVQQIFEQLTLSIVT